jgi:predicted MFS family arabinose efflux permease
LENKNNYRFVILFTVVLVRSCVGLVWSSIGPLLPLIIQEYELSRSSASWMASITPLTIAVVSLPITVIGAKYSLKKTFAVGAILQGGGLLALLATNYLFLLFTRVCFAIGTAIVVPVATMIAAQWFSSRRLPQINSIIMVSINLGSAIAFVATIPIATAYSWKAPMIAYGVVALVFGIAWMVFGKDQTKVITKNEAIKAPVSDERSDLTLRQILTHKSTIVLALALIGTASLGNSMGSWLPSYYHEVFKMPLEKASSILVVITVGGTLACIAGGIFAMRLGRHKPLLIISGSLMGLSALTAVLFNNLAVIYIGVALYGIFGNLSSPSLFTIPMELPDMSMRSGVIVISVMIAGGNIGNFIGPLIVGFLTDITGSYLSGFVTVSVLSLSLLAAGLLLDETGPKAKKL